MNACRVIGCERRVRKSGLCFGHVRRGETAEVAPRAASLARDELGRKRCHACTQWLPLEDFTKDHHAKDGLRSLCLDCHTSRRRVTKYGVSAEWFDRTLDAQGGCCAICRSPEPRGRGWAIDHDHSCCPDKGSSCGACIRAILCSPCNLALGLMGDNPDTLRAAADYIGWHGRLSIEPERMSIVRGV